MYLVLLSLIFTLMLSTISLNMSISRKHEKLKTNMAGDKLNTLSYKDELSNSTYRGGRTSYKGKRIDKELVTKVLLRTCRSLYVKAKENGCSNPVAPSTVWGFVGTVNTTGNLIDAWNGTATNTFSCSNMNSYGRGLVQKAIPKSFIQSRAYRYDLLNMSSTGRYDPCGYGEIIDLL